MPYLWGTDYAVWGLEFLVDIVNLLSNPLIIAAYLLGGLILDITLIVYLGPRMTKKLIMRELKGEYGRILVNEFFTVLKPHVQIMIKDMMRDPGVGTFFTVLIKDNLPAVKGWVAAELQKPESQRYLADMAASMLVTILDSELEIQTEKGTEKIGIIQYFSSAVVHNLEMRWLGDKGVLSKDMKAAEGLIVGQNLPPQIAALAAPVMQYAKRYPFLNMIMQFALQSGAIDKFKSMQGGVKNDAVSSYRGA